ncbi:SIR2 family NAD-dependent protein deacylase [Acidovorax sp.]|uniref:SIR2 family NAD-dependent protein deacylase n=1 Tax=Acidovorax sp. TaxID=1872122 RepID=UPI00391FAA51
MASLMAHDLHEDWWKLEEYKESRSIYQGFSKDKTSALRFEICRYIASLTSTQLNFVDGLAAEVEALRNLNIEGIITTNWDNLAEILYPDYKVYVGQDELLFSNPQSIGEIYKIHGGADRPHSLVLTAEDYTDFYAKNPYLASKLITLFVEHPMVFIGYSLADKNIRSLLRAIASVLTQEKLDKLSENLIFIQRAHGENPSYAKTVMALDDGNLPITIIRSDNFLPVYEALDAVKRKIPTRILRYCKEQLYELVKSSDVEGKMYVVDANTITKKDDVEFVIGVGVAAERAGAIGYKAINAYDLFEDLLFEKNQFDAQCVLRDTTPIIGIPSKFIPIFKYLKDAGIDNQKSYKSSDYDLDNYMPFQHEHYTTSSYKKAFTRDAVGFSALQIVDSFPAGRAANYLAYLKKKDFDLPVIKDFLKKNFEVFRPRNPSTTPFRKLACMYDYYSNGWEVKKSKSE